MWSGNLKHSVVNVKTFLCNTLSNPARDQELGHNNALISPLPPTTECDIKEQNWRGVQEFIKAVRSASAPGPMGVTYNM